jgi:CheY-like chemotaxis protein
MALAEEARRGASMVQQLLTFAKGVDGKRVAVCSRPLFSELEQIVASTFPKNISARFTCAGDAPEVTGDSTQLHQVLLNLCVNARDAMPEGGTLTVEASARHITPLEAHAFGEDCVPGQYLQWRVSDTGHGIPRALIERIFEPFYSTKSPEKGTGLGLSTTIGIVRSHGGFVRVHSELGKGSMFSVFIPVTQESLEEDGAPAPAADLHAAGQSVLVVDDEPAVREILRQILTTLGLHVQVATDGRAALDLLRSAPAPFAAVITDLHMPVMDGLALAREARRLHPSTPIILSSGRVDKAHAAAIQEIGFTGTLDKPFTLESLSAALGPLVSVAPSTAA